MTPGGSRRRILSLIEDAIRRDIHLIARQAVMQVQELVVEPVGFRPLLWVSREARQGLGGRASASMESSEIWAEVRYCAEGPET